MACLGRVLACTNSRTRALKSLGPTAEVVRWWSWPEHRVSRNGHQADQRTLFCLNSKLRVSRSQLFPFLGTSLTLRMSLSSLWVFPEVTTEEVHFLAGLELE